MARATEQRDAGAVSSTLGISVSLFGMSLTEYGPLAVAAEDLSYEAVWLADHLATPTTRTTTYPYSPNGDPGYDPTTPIADVWAVGGLLAGLTTRLLIGTGVYILPLRPLAVTARAASTVQSLSQGRLLFGIGTGWLAEEFAAAGAQLAGRGAWTDEAIPLLHRLWTGDPVAHDGPHIQLPEITVAPGVPAPIPVVVGGATPPALRRAALLGDGWYGPPCDLAASATSRDAIDAVRTAACRTGDFTYYARLAPPYHAATAAAYEDAEFTHVVVTLAGAGGTASDPLDRKVELLADAMARLTA